MKDLIKFALVPILVVATAGNIEARTLSDQNYAIGMSLKNRPGKAIPYFARAIKLDSRSAKAYLARGQAYLELEKLDLALADFNKAIMLNIKNPKVYYSRARLYFESGKPHKAIEDFNKFISLSVSKPDKGDGYRNLGNIYCGLKQYDKGLACYTKAVETDGESTNYWLRGNVYFKQGRYKLAIADFTSAIKKKDTADDVKYYSSRAKTYEKIGKKKLAEKDWHYVTESIKNGFGDFADMEIK